MNCRYHPEEIAVAVCQKFGYGYCRTCCEAGEDAPHCECSSPNVHCKFRQECIVSYVEKSLRAQSG